MPYLLIFVFQLRDQNYTVRFKSDDLNHQNSSHWIKKQQQANDILLFLGCFLFFHLCFLLLLLSNVFTVLFLCLFSPFLLVSTLPEKRKTNSDRCIFFLSLLSLMYSFPPMTFAIKDKKKSRSNILINARVESRHMTSTRDRKSKEACFA